MGLDAVELVMEIEDRFNITLPDPDCQRVRTVADLAALVIRQLPRHNAACPTAHTFFEFRRLLVTHAGFTRKHIRPTTPLTSLFPPGSRRRWDSLRKHNRRLPKLTATPRAHTVLKWAAAITALTWLIATALLWGSQGVSIAFQLSAAVTLTAGLFALRLFADNLAQHFPPELQTVGDLTRLITPLALDQGGPGERLIAQQQVLHEVRRITAQQLGFPLDQVHPTSDFVNDLKLD